MTNGIQKNFHDWYVIVSVFVSNGFSLIFGRLYANLEFYLVKVTWQEQKSLTWIMKIQQAVSYIKLTILSEKFIKNQLCNNK